jgi:hypothetical protein
MPKSARQESAFLNIPYDRQYESLYLAFIAGLCAFGLRPRATIEIPSTRRRLERIVQLIRGCRYSFHDLSRVQLDRHFPATPRFNMPFELGLAVGWALGANPKHEWFVFESKHHRLEKSLSDLNGTDPHVHDGTAHGVLRGLTNALARKIHDPNMAELTAIYRDLSKAAHRVKLERKGGSLFEARPFQYLVFLARRLAQERISSLRP